MMPSFLAAATFVTLSSAINCPETTDYYLSQPKVGFIPIKDLSPRSPNHPTIDGNPIDTTEYPSHLKHLMYNSGHNLFINGNPHIGVDPNSVENWIQFASGQKLGPDNMVNFALIVHPLNSITYTKVMKDAGSWIQLQA